MPKLRRAAVLGLLLAATSLPARAEAGDAVAAEKLFREGAAALKQGELEVACEKLSQSNALDPAIGTLGLLALCHEQQGHLATAVAEYRTVSSLARSANQPDRAAIAAGKVEELSPHVSHLKLTFPDDLPEGLVIEVAGHRLSDSEAGLPYPLDAGPVALRFSAEGFETVSQTAQLPADGITLRLRVPALKRPVAPALAKPEPPATPAPSAHPAAGSSSSGGVSALTWTAVGTGIAGVALGSYFGLNALSSNSRARSHCTSNDCDSSGVDLRQQALHQATASTVAFAIGTAALGASLVLYLARDREQPRLSAEASALQNGGQLTLRGGF